MSLQKNPFWSGEEIYKEKERKGGRFMGDLKGWKKCQRSMCIFIYVHMYMYMYIYIYKTNCEYGVLPLFV